jgi:hypothetical protein
MRGNRVKSGWWVTTACNDLEAFNALALAKSLKLTLTPYDMAVIITDDISARMR